MTLALGAFSPAVPWGAARWAAAAAVTGVALAWVAIVNLSGAALFGVASNPELRVTAAALTQEHDAFTVGLGLVEHRTLEVARGESLVQALRRAGATYEEGRAADTQLEQVMDVDGVKPGLSLTATFERAGVQPRLTGVSFRSAPGAVVSLNLAHDGAFRARLISMPLTFEVAHAAGKVETSLYDAAVKAGAGEREIQAIADVFAYDIDFQRDIFPGDTFEIVFERYRDDAGQTVRTGEALFVSLQTRGGQKSYYRFKPPVGDYDWYDPEGRTARKFLMKTPINGARLSSGFGMRTHPVLGFSRMHRGVDFAAPVGTPVMAAGDGVVERVGWGGGLGNMVQIRHADGYETVYGHMSGFARGLRVGEQVRQGQLIGYVGSTGMSTGPHLHYEVILRGDHINPMDMRVPTGRNLETAAMSQFRAEKARIDALRARRGAGGEAGDGLGGQIVEASGPAPARTGDGLRGSIE
jgi:murein DD-endopeptidase MepM/ murein hydrolase activator NlpD